MSTDDAAVRIWCGVLGQELSLEGVSPSSLVAMLGVDSTPSPPAQHYSYMLTLTASPPPHTTHSFILTHQ